MGKTLIAAFRLMQAGASVALFALAVVTAVLLGFVLGRVVWLFNLPMRLLGRGWDGRHRVS